MASIPRLSPLLVQWASSPPPFSQQTHISYVSPDRPFNPVSPLTIASLSPRTASLRLPNRRNKWFFRLHPAIARVALIQHPLHSGDRPRNRAERLLWCSRPDRWSVDLQVGRGKARVSDGPLDECSPAAARYCRVFGAEGVLWVEESAVTAIGQGEICLLSSITHTHTLSLARSLAYFVWWAGLCWVNTIFF